MCFADPFLSSDTKPGAIKVMAILNVTPDSFSDGGKLDTVSAAVRQADRALRAGADILDIGGESTRPGALTVDSAEEIQRTQPVIQAIHQVFPDALISIDTRKAVVAEAALQAGARMVNDVSGLQYDPALAEVVARHRAYLVIMHSQGVPQTMQENPVYPQGVVESLLAFFERQIQLAVEAGIQRERLILDPGFGFGKTVDHNIALLRHLDVFHRLALPVLVGISRKSFLTLGDKNIAPTDREALTAAAVALALQQGATIVRVHDVDMHVPVIRLIEAILDSRQKASIS